MVSYAKTQKVERLTRAMTMLLDGSPVKHVKDTLNLTYASMASVGLIDRVKFKDKEGKFLGLGPYVCSLKPDIDRASLQKVAAELINNNN